jgi:hypothetical protein
MAEPEKRHAMQTPEGQLDPEAVTLMGRVCSEAWSEVLEVTFFITPQLEREARRRMSDAVISAVIAGERDFERLRSIAPSAVGGCRHGD